MALYFFNYSTWTGRPGLYVRVRSTGILETIPRIIYLNMPRSLRAQLEDLFVDPDHRGNGVGKAFFGELGKIAQERVCSVNDLTSLRLLFLCGELLY